MSCEIRTVLTRISDSCLRKSKTVRLSSMLASRCGTGRSSWVQGQSNNGLVVVAVVPRVKPEAYKTEKRVQMTTKSRTLHETFGGIARETKHST